MQGSKIVSAVLLCLMSGLLTAEEASTLAPVSQNHSNGSVVNETVDTAELIHILIKEGVLEEKRLEELLKEAKQQKARDYNAAIETVAEKDLERENNGHQQSGKVRVPYIPAYIKDEIRDRVRSELREEVVADVMAQARKESWGVPGTNPSWTKKIKLSGDIRLRAESIQFAEKNSLQDIDGDPILYLDYTAINDAGGVLAAGEDAFFNITQNRDRMRLRARLNVKAEITPGIEAGMRIVSGNIDDPVSANETLGDYGSGIDISLDRAYVKYNNYLNTIELFGGRFANPFFSTDLVWDNDYNFEGLAATYWYLRSDTWDEDDIYIDPFLTLGVFPLKELELSSNDTWLVAAQTGFNFTPASQNILTMALAYYNFIDIHGERNSLNSIENNVTAPEFFQKGNLVFDISNDSDPDTQLFALAADYDLVNLTLEYDIARFAPHHIIVGVDYVKNIGFDVAEIAQRAKVSESVVLERVDGYSVKVVYGWPQVTKRRDWQVEFIYKNLERDAVVDAFTDSDFHLGGTDGKGFIFKYKYGLAENTRLDFKWLNSDEIDLLPFGVDIFQLDIVSKF